MAAWVEGIDAAWSRPTPAQLVAIGKTFIIGYVSHDPAKNLTPAECVAYLDAGIAVGLVWETVSDRALDGRAAGAADGTMARRQARVLGFPDDRPIFAAVDFDASGGQLAGPVRAYLTGFASAVGGTGVAGVYGGLDTVRYALNTQLVGWGWQTYAWSHGVWDARAQIRQYRNAVHINGHDTDLDRAVDLAAFWTKEAEMTPDDFLKILADPRVAALMRAFPWQYDGRGIPPNMSTLGVLNGTYVAVTSASASAIAAAVVAALPAGTAGGVTVEEIAAAVHAELARIAAAVSTELGQ